MRRRRFPGRPVRRKPLAGMPPNRRPIPPKLREAHRLFETGEYEKAAKLYADLAVKAQERGFPQAPNLFLRCGVSWLKAGDLEQAQEMTMKGLGILAVRKKWMQLKKSGALAVERMKAEGQVALAGEIESWLEAQVPEAVRGSDAWKKQVSFNNRADSVKLPSNCSKCGGPVNPKELDWVDAQNPVCAFCGVILVTEM